MLAKDGTESGLVDRAGLRNEPTYDEATVTADIGQLRRVIVSRGCDTGTGENDSVA